MRIVAVLCALVMPFVSAAQTASPAPEKVSTDEYAIYAAVTMQLFWKPDSRIALINGKTRPIEIPAKFVTYLSEQFSTLEDATIADLRHKPDAALQLRFPLKVNYRIVEGEAVSFGQTPPWKPDYPNSTGVLSLSRVGFNPARDQGLVFVRQYCGALCSLELWVLLSKQQDGEWHVTKKLITGAS